MKVFQILSTTALALVATVKAAPQYIAARAVLVSGDQARNAFVNTFPDVIPRNITQRLSAVPKTYWDQYATMANKARDDKDMYNRVLTVTEWLLHGQIPDLNATIKKHPDWPAPPKPITGHQEKTFLLTAYFAEFLMQQKIEIIKNMPSQVWDQMADLQNRIDKTTDKNVAKGMHSQLVNALLSLMEGQAPDFAHLSTEVSPDMMGEELHP
ncbi:hypothetical protein TWF694_010597 [Orbilia ellipsospora]|uniref:DUF148 domain-containing protein n=1 Tax=Orbilia ellipsospora TaxID=2528407 RepID=A0AAV9XBI5_9PEZI